MRILVLSDSFCPKYDFFLRSWKNFKFFKRPGHSRWKVTPFSLFQTSIGPSFLLVLFINDQKTITHSKLAYSIFMGEGHVPWHMCKWWGDCWELIPSFHCGLWQADVFPVKQCHRLIFLSLFLLYLYYLSCVHVFGERRDWTFHGEHMEIRGQLVGIGS